MFVTLLHSCKALRRLTEFKTFWNQVIQMLLFVQFCKVKILKAAQNMLNIVFWSKLQRFSFLSSRHAMNMFDKGLWLVLVKLSKNISWFVKWVQCKWCNQLSYFIKLYLWCLATYREVAAKKITTVNKTHSGSCVLWFLLWLSQETLSFWFCYYNYSETSL